MRHRITFLLAAAAVGGLILAAHAGTAVAGGFGLPTPRSGLGFGNLPDFSGVRLNLGERGISRMAGVTVDNETRTVEIRTETPWLWDDEDGPFHRRRGIRFRY